jgi:hypothetical protein|eukprot:COSAG01_NODE_3325_length_6252_cov_17.673980_3_plen_439_part_00
MWELFDSSSSSDDEADAAFSHRSGVLAQLAEAGLYELAEMVSQELGLNDVLAVRGTNRFWRTVGSSHSLWSGRCVSLWNQPMERYVRDCWRQQHVDGEAYRAYIGSLRESRQCSVSEAELLSLSPWYFRFKRAAGTDAVRSDPFWQDGEAWRVYFFCGGRFERRGGSGGDQLLGIGQWRFVPRVGTGQWGPLGSFLRMTVDSRPDAAVTTILEPEPEPGPRVATLDRPQELPTYHCSRHPDHWGIALESCWSLLTAFPLPSPRHAHAEDDAVPQLMSIHAAATTAANFSSSRRAATSPRQFLRVSVAMQLTEIEAFHRGDPLDGIACSAMGDIGARQSDAMDEAMARRHATGGHSMELVRVGEALYRVPRAVMRQLREIKLAQDRGEDSSDEDDEERGWMRELIQLLQMQADDEEAESDEVLLADAVFMPDSEDEADE